MTSMPLELYLQETAVLARKQEAILEEACQKMEEGALLSPLEESGVLHALQLLIENAIGKAKQILKHSGEPVPTSAYDAMQSLVHIKGLPAESFLQWAAIIGLRNRIAHEYMSLDMRKVMELVQVRSHKMVVEFLLEPIDT